MAVTASSGFFLNCQISSDESRADKVEIAM